CRVMVEPVDQSAAVHSAPSARAICAPTSGLVARAVTGRFRRRATARSTDFFSVLPGPRGSGGAPASAYRRATASALDEAGRNRSVGTISREASGGRADPVGGRRVRGGRRGRL